MLPGLPQDPRDRDRVVVSAPRREVVEIRTDDQRVLHILEPINTGLVPHRLAAHTDVATASPTDGQSLAWVAGTGEWTPTTIAGGPGGGITLAEADARYYQRTLVDSLLDGKDDEGTALTIFTNHVAASDPHTQYALNSALAPVATSGAYSALTGKPTIPATFDDLTGTVPTSALPALAITDTFTVATQVAMLALTAQRGDVAIRSDLVAAFILAAEPATTLANWVRLPTPVDAVLSVNGQTGVVVLAKGDVGLGAVANLAPADLPVSTATATALAGKAGLGVTDALDDRLDAAETAITTKADATTTTAALATKADATTTTNALAGKVALSLVDAKGDLIVGTADNALTRLAAGSNGFVLTVDSAQASGLKWAEATSTTPGPAAAEVDGFASWTGDPLNWTTLSGLGDGNAQWVRIPVPAGKAITTLWVCVGIAGSYLASSGRPNQLALSDDDGNLLSLTPDDNTLYTVQGWRSGTLVSPQAAQATPRWVYVALTVGDMTGLQLRYPTTASTFVGSTDANTINGGPEPRRRSMYVNGLSALPSAFDPTTYGTVTPYLPLVALSG